MTPLRPRFSRLARSDFREAFQYYEAQRKGLGREFAVEVGNTVRKVLEHPLRWPVISGDVRKCRTDRFPYGVLYKVKADHVRILTVMHLRRKPGYWERGSEE